MIIMISLYSIDVAILEFVNLSYHTPFTNLLAQLVSCMGILYFGLAVALILYLLGGEKEKHVAKRLFVILLVTYVLVQIVKSCVMRPRPYTVLSTLIVVSLESDFSFPSGHTALSTVWSYVLGKNYGHRRYFMIIPILVGISRLYLGVHYPSDVIVGFLFGIFTVYLCEYLFMNKTIRKYL